MRIRAILGAAACAALVTACGSSSSSGSGGHHGAPRNTPYGPKSSPYAMSKCMRANGLTRFPDPVSTTGGVGFPEGIVFASDGQLTVDGVTFSGPVLKQAELACKEFMPGGGGPPPTISASQKRQLLRMARCMRANGVPNFPDPGTPGAQAPIKASKVVLGNTNAPAFRHAAQVCSVGHGEIRFTGSNVAIQRP